MQKVYTKIESIVGNVVTVRASGVRSGDLALVGESYASVIKLSGDLVSLQVFAGTQGVSTTDTVRFLGRPMMVSFSDDLLGRVFDGAGVPRDNGPALTENMIPIGGPSVNPAKRIVPKRMIRTGIPTTTSSSATRSKRAARWAAQSCSSTRRLIRRWNVRSCPTCRSPWRSSSPLPASACLCC